MRRLALVGAGIALAAALFALSPVLGGAGSWLRDGAYLATLVLLVCVALVLAAESEGTTRWTWLLLASAGLVWMAAEGGALLARSLAPDGEMSFWLVLGAGSLVAYGLLLTIGLSYTGRSSRAEWVLGLLDASLLLLAAAAPWGQFFVLDRIGAAGGSRLVPVLLLAPAAAALLAMGILLAYSAPRFQICSFVILLAVASGLAGDLIASLHLLTGSPGVRGALVAWEGRAAGLCLVGALAGAPAIGRTRWRLRPGVLRLALVVAGFTITMGTASVAFAGDHMIAALALGSYASAALVVRFLVHTFSRQRDAERLRQALREQEQLAVVDPLTGLFNRRFFDAQLKLELDRAVRAQASVGLLVIDLDHFKRTNDTYGHLVGDDILREVARRLLAAVRTGDIVARYGGEEFVVLLPAGDASQLREIGERCRLAVRGRPVLLTDGRELETTVSVGGASWPDDATSVRDLFHSADIALYRAKELGRDRVQLSAGRGQMPRDSLPFMVPPSGHLHHAGAQQEPQLPAEPEQPVPPIGSPGMARWARLAARALGLDPGAQERTAVAARFHDVGKYVVPQAILGKQGPLTSLEWEVVRMHPEYGAWLIELLPEFQGVGQIIREHHERVDGRGYPEGKGWQDISREARIVAVCDAWLAMRNGRPYAGAKSESEARAELLAGRGSQFDAEIVETFLMFDEAGVASSEEPEPASLRGEQAPQAPAA
ncbi:MAG: bifunctional diguanylate cyclase/phosphohydrolase [Gaiellaceae bacterium]